MSNKVETINFNGLDDLHKLGYVEKHIYSSIEYVLNKFTLVFNYFGIENVSFLNWAAFKVFLISVAVMLIYLLVKFVLTNLFFKVFSKTATKLDNDLLSVIYPAILQSILLAGLIAILWISGLSFETVQALDRMIISVFWIIWGFVATKVSRIVLIYFSDHVSSQSLVRKQTLPLFFNFSILIVSIFFSYQILRTWDVDMTALLASAGVLGLALGFAAKDTLSNLFSGVFILADQPYKIGDFVVLDSKERGEVTHIGIRSTRILTRDDVEVTVPNAIMGNTKIINESGGPYKKFRIRVQVGVAYGSKIDHVRGILLRIALDNNHVCKDPAPRVRFRVFGASSLDFELLCWIIDPALRGRVLDILNEEVYNAFVSEEIEIPYQKQDLYIKEIPKKPV